MQVSSISCYLFLFSLYHSLSFPPFPSVLSTVVMIVNFRTSDESQMLVYSYENEGIFVLSKGHWCILMVKDNSNLQFSGKMSNSLAY